MICIAHTTGGRECFELHKKYGLPDKRLTDTYLMSLSSSKRERWVEIRKADKKGKQKRHAGAGGRSTWKGANSSKKQKN